MPRFRVWGLSAALVAGGTSAALADSEPRGPEQGTVISKIQQMFAPRKPKPAGPTVPGRPVTITAPLKPEVVADALRAEQDAYLRRMSVCYELRQVAESRGDGSLARQVDELERQAAAVYNARVTGLGISRVKAPLPEGAMAAAAPEKPLDPDNVAAARARRLSAPAAPVPGTTTAEVREVTP